jgi:glutathione synthase
MKKKILAIQGSSLAKVNTETDTTLLLALEAQLRGFEIYYFEPQSMSYQDGKVYAACKVIKLYSNQKQFYKIKRKVNFDLSLAKYLLIRNDPPFNQQYFNTTFLLEQIVHKVKIINDPHAVRNVQEKLYSLKFKRYMPNTLISEDLHEIKKFIKKNKKVVIKPINGFSGNEVKLLKNFNSKLIKTYIKKYHQIILQKFLPKISLGDRRVFIINGKVVGSITRIPKKGSILSNMSKGAIARQIKLTKTELKVSKLLAKDLKKSNIYFAGIDFVDGQLIGDINVTSPTGLMAYFNLTNINLAKYFWDNV